MPDEPAVRMDVFEEFVEWGGVGDIASSLAGEQQFASRAIHFFKEQDLAAQFCRTACGQDSRGTGTDDDDVVGWWCGIAAA